MFDEKMLKGKKKDMPESYKKAKMSVLQDLHKTASDAMKGDIERLKKVTVASDSEEGLKEGLEKALAMKMPLEEMEEEEKEEYPKKEYPRELTDEDVEEEAPMQDDEGRYLAGEPMPKVWEDLNKEVKGMSPEELDKVIQYLKDKKMKMA